MRDFRRSPRRVSWMMPRTRRFASTCIPWPRQSRTCCSRRVRSGGSAGPRWRGSPPARREGGRATASRRHGRAEHVEHLGQGADYFRMNADAPAWAARAAIGSRIGRSPRRRPRPGRPPDAAVAEGLPAAASRCSPRRRPAGGPGPWPRPRPQRRPYRATSCQQPRELRNSPAKHPVIINDENPPGRDRG